ncbi:hypothetical protein AUG19_05030 [archaeon 13_1_20CM_2_54_9]|nr:MAG: hypothetical protein AUG19_05030 [archaeon 13_1_20CM_2_54_9]
MVRRKKKSSSSSHPCRWQYTSGCQKGLAIVAATSKTLSLPPNQVGALIGSVGVTTTIISQLVNILANVALFLGVFGLVKRFENQSKPS